jgi:hypothetical protein
MNGSPKSEARNPKEIRSPKSEWRSETALATMPFGNSVVPRVSFVPQGHRENSPAFQRWEHDQKAVSPEGTAEILHSSFCLQPSDQPSLRDLGLLASIPGLEKAGLFSFVPPGHKAASEQEMAAEARTLWREAKELNLIFGAIWRK